MAAVRCSLKPLSFSVALLAVVAAGLSLPPVATGCANGVRVPGATDEVLAAVGASAAAALKVVAPSPAPGSFGGLPDPSNPTRHRIAELGVESHVVAGALAVFRPTSLCERRATPKRFSRRRAAPMLMSELAVVLNSRLLLMLATSADAPAARGQV